MKDKRLFVFVLCSLSLFSFAQEGENHFGNKQSRIEDPSTIEDYNVLRDSFCTNPAGFVCASEEDYLNRVKVKRAETSRRALLAIKDDVSPGAFKFLQGLSNAKSDLKLGIQVE